MRLHLPASVFLLLLSACPVCESLSLLPEDSDASGFDMEGSGWASGDASELVSPQDFSNKDGRMFTENLEEGNTITLQGSSDLDFDPPGGPPSDSSSELVLLSNGYSFLSDRDILAGIIAGGVTGATAGAALSAILIYLQKKKDKKQCQKKAAHRECHTSNRREALV
ncbi:uncharacterized protein ACNS7B_002022 [Menidia menidia]